MCKKCPFKTTCLPDLDFGTELKIADDPSLESKIDEWKEKEEFAKQVKKLYENEIKPRIKASVEDGEINVILGKYRITGKEDKRGSLRSKIEVI